MGQSRPLFCLFLFFSRYNFNTNWKKRRWCAWDSNLGPQDGRRRQNHGAMAATNYFYNLFMTSVPNIIAGLRPFLVTEGTPRIFKASLWQDFKSSQMFWKSQVIPRTTNTTKLFIQFVPYCAMLYLIMPDWCMYSAHLSCLKWPLCHAATTFVGKCNIKALFFHILLCYWLQIIQQ